jgi:elongation factor Tu
MSDRNLHHADLPFLMPILEVHNLERQGTVAVGEVYRGRVRRGDELEVVGLHPKTSKVRVKGFGGFTEKLDEHWPGDNAALILGDIHPIEIERGTILAAPGSIAPHRKFTAHMYVLSREEGGRRGAFFSGYRPLFDWGAQALFVGCEVELPPDVTSVMPGQSVTLTISLLTWVAIESGLPFAFRDGGQVVARGEVLDIIE